MKYSRLEVGMRCRISYDKSFERMRRWEAGLLPPAGCIVRVIKILNLDYTLPIRIQFGTKKYKCHPSDLRSL